MKRSLILLMGILLILTGCQKKQEINDKMTSTSTTTSVKTSKMTTEEVLASEDDKSNPTDSINEDEKITTNTITKITTTTNKDKTTKTSSAYNPTTSSTTTTTTSKKTTSTTKKTTTTSKKTTTTTKKTTTTSKKTTTTNNNTLTEKEVYNRMIALKTKYPTGTPWSNSKCYEWKGGIVNKGCGCAGFAFTLSDAAFGSAKAKKHTDVSKIRVGDILRLYNDTHSVIVLEVNSTGVTVAEGNMTIVGSFENGVYWGRKISNSELKKDVNFIYTRW